MGGKSSSKASTSTTAKTDNTNQQGNTAPISTPKISIGGGKYVTASVKVSTDQSKTNNIRNTFTDFGAVNKSIELSADALKYYDKMNSRSLLEMSKNSSGAFEFAERALEIVGESKEPDDTQNYQALLKWGAFSLSLYILGKKYL